MSDLRSLREAVAKLAMLQRSLAALSGGDENQANWRHQHIDYRRDLQAQIGTISSLAATIDGLAPDDRSALGDALSRMRTALALHQADWPAVSIRPNDLLYRQSVQRVRIANEAFAKVASMAFANHGQKGNE